MRQNIWKCVSQAVAWAMIAVCPAAAQTARVKFEKHATIPKTCESVTPATLEGQLDIPALLKEANCKGSGDMIGDYTYVLRLVKREQQSKGRVNEHSIVYEVFMPTLKSGARGQGVLLVTSRDGQLVPLAELEKERLRAGKQLEEAENKTAKSPVSPPQASADSTTGLRPLGAYVSTRNLQGKFGIGRGSAVLNVHTFLTHCELTLLRREPREGRETLVLSFTARTDARFNDSEKYIAQLKGMIWIDATDHIVTRLVGWPLRSLGERETASEKPPAIYVEMMRLPEGVWLPAALRINGADYPELFDHMTYDSTSTYSEYKRFLTEINDVQVGKPKEPLPKE
jgi:hypothetical protein